MGKLILTISVTSLVIVTTFCGCDDSKKGAATGTSTASATPVLASATPTSTLPRTDAGRLKPLARKVLTFCQNQDIEALALMVADSDKDEMKKSLQPGQSAHERLFGKDGWRHKAIDSWNEEVSEIRTKGEEARAKFGEIDGKQAAVVVFRKKSGVWYFEGIENPTKEDFATWGEPAK
jgi:hypothetical protein